MFGIDEEFCASCIDWHKAFDCINWTKLIQIINETGIDWHERLIRKFYMDHRVKLRQDQGQTKCED